VTEQLVPDGRAIEDQRWRERQARKQVKRLRQETRKLDPWERYRALNDAMDEYYEVLDMANREARFALIIVGALNAVLFVIGTRSSLVSALPAGARPWMGLVLVAYGGVALHFFLQAIEVLRPRKYHPRLPESAMAAERYPTGVRYYEDVIRRDAEGHCRAWDDVRVSQLNAELAVQGHSLSLKARAKHHALRRLFGGLRLMTLLAGGMLMVMVIFAVVQ
jgi:hypothetical protein